MLKPVNQFVGLLLITQLQRMELWSHVIKEMAPFTLLRKWEQENILGEYYRTSTDSDSRLDTHPNVAAWARRGKSYFTKRRHVPHNGFHLPPSLVLNGEHKRHCPPKRQHCSTRSWLDSWYKEGTDVEFGGTTGGAKRKAEKQVCTMNVQPNCVGNFPPWGTPPPKTPHKQNPTGVRKYKLLHMMAHQGTSVTDMVSL